jgi:hypothetical protein
MSMARVAKPKGGSHLRAISVEWRLRMSRLARSGARSPTLDAEMLVRHLFTLERLSVQCHLADDAAPAGGEPRARTRYPQFWRRAQERLSASTGERRSAARSCPAPRSMTDQAATGLTGRARGLYILFPCRHARAIGSDISLVEISKTSTLTASPMAMASSTRFHSAKRWLRRRRAGRFG